MTGRFSRDLILQVAGGLLVALIGYVVSQMFTGDTVDTSSRPRMSQPHDEQIQRDLNERLRETKRLADELEKQKQIDAQRTLEHERRQAELERERLRNAAAQDEERRRLQREQQAFREEMRQRESENAQRAATDCNDPNYNVYLDPGNCNKPHEFDQRWSRQ